MTIHNFGIEYNTTNNYIQLCLRNLDKNVKDVIDKDVIIIFLINVQKHIIDLNKFII
jgi:hypothetical protein